MARKYGVQATQAQNSPAELAEQGYLKGRLSVLEDTYTLSADLALNDVIEMGELPKGARILDVRLIFGAMGGSAAVNIGWEASAELTVGSTTPIEAADADGFGAAVSVSSAGVYSMFTSQSTVPGMGKTFAANCKVVIAISTDSSSTSASYRLQVLYVVD